MESIVEDIDGHHVNSAHSNNEVVGAASTAARIIDSMQCVTDPAMIDLGPISVVSEHQQELVTVVVTTTDCIDNNMYEDNSNKSAMDEQSLSVTHTTSLPLPSKSSSSFICRICHNSDHSERLISPCLCKGSLGHVHRTCLEHWLCCSGLTVCELCRFRFRTNHSLRYNLWQSLKVWYGHPNNCGLLQTDMLACSIITFLTIILVCICLLSFNYYHTDQTIGLTEPFGGGIPTKVWMEIGIVSVLIIVVLVYLLNLWATLHAQLMPWYRWWQSARDISVEIN